MMALDIYLLGIWQTMSPLDLDEGGVLRPAAQFWLRASCHAHYRAVRGCKLKAVR